MELSEVNQAARTMRENIEKVIIGKSFEINLVLTALLAGGHVLLEDVPGTGKTMLAKALSKTVALDMKRIQFTPDLLPTDLIGLNTYNPKTGDFNFRKGALFTNILLADEINRATPRTQSSLLESMEERQITVDGVTYPLEPPYFVIATQNPVETQGTFPLPEAQLDRFLIQMSMGYPDTEESVRIAALYAKENPLPELEPVCSAKTLSDMQEAVKRITVHDDVVRYAVDIAESTRKHEAVSLGVSPRGCISLIKAAMSFAAIDGRDFVTPDDIRTLCPYVLGHRIILRAGHRSRQAQISGIIAEVLKSVKAPVEEWK